ncbi:thioredoxin-related transmembrane protein 1 [Strongylocentrotus purpuratus]|uniref:Thioredoxin domain-containing protein n=1 Tax=Strongylocentrotus purpuratus TaxID=7668 RepID=A0A7M7RC96_STRPU|nr:thioredoxin-related transmembrane protein 1 [Strongylocentrotus purpuratus]|eukprot:XP_787930.3 PREDICTED: thioredoxin-related transmembrane protein 1 [Strongylocentrotus purpuratus]
MYPKREVFILLFLICVFRYGESGKTNVVKITDKDWSRTLEGEWLIKFYAPWCPACKSIMPVWKELSDWSQELNTNIAEVDVTEEPGLSGRFAVTSLPSIFHAKDGIFRRYLGPRTKDDLISLVEERKYEEIEPVAGWQSPNSIAMTILSWVFKMSMLVRITHTILTEEYGFPSWSSYGFFAVVTVMIGLILGMILVMVADFFFPVKPPTRQEIAYSQLPQDGEGTADERKKEEEEEDKEGEGEGAIDEGNSGDQTVRKRKSEKDNTQSEQTS